MRPSYKRGSSIRKSYSSHSCSSSSQIEEEEKDEVQRKDKDTTATICQEQQQQQQVRMEQEEVDCLDSPVRPTSSDTTSQQPIAKEEEEEDEGSVDRKRPPTRPASTATCSPANRKEEYLYQDDDDDDDVKEKERQRLVSPLHDDKTNQGKTKAYSYRNQQQTPKNVNDLKETTKHFKDDTIKTKVAGIVMVKKEDEDSPQTQASSSGGRVRQTGNRLLQIPGAFRAGGRQLRGGSSDDEEDRNSEYFESDEEARLDGDGLAVLDAHLAPDEDSDNDNNTATAATTIRMTIQRDPNDNDDNEPSLLQVGKLIGADNPSCCYCRKRSFLCSIIVLVVVILLAVLLGILILSSSSSQRGLPQQQASSLSTVPTLARTRAPTVRTMETAFPTTTPLPTLPPTTTGTVTLPFDGKCFVRRAELLAAVDIYLEDNSPNSVAAQAYGWPIGGWCVFEIHIFDNLFSTNRNPRAAFFNEDLSQWNMSGATDMDFMFQGAAAFNQDLSQWDVSSVRNMHGAFYQATSFNADLGGWNVERVLRMANLFAEATSFHADLSAWNVTSVTTVENLFWDAASYNHDLCAWAASMPPGRAVETSGMFYGTACPTTDDPNRTVTHPRRGPYCHVCEP